MSSTEPPWTNASTPLLACDGLRIGHRGQALLPPLNWQVRPGELWAIVGANGSGKTTLLRTLLGLHPAVGGRCIRARTGRVAYVGQLQPFADEAPLRVVDLLRSGALRGKASLWGWGCRLAQGPTRALLAEFDLVDLAERRYHELSCGQQQRALLARALASAPELLCLDEPTSAMDAATTAQTLRLLRNLVRHRGLAALVVGHQLAPLLDAASHVLWLRSEAPRVQLGPATSLRRRVLDEAMGLAGSWADVSERADQTGPGRDDGHAGHGNNEHLPSAQTADAPTGTALRQARSPTSTAASGRR